MGLDMTLMDNRHHEVKYWRKANAIHGWIETHIHAIENCEDVEIKGWQLKELIHDCKKVLADHSLADAILPATPGFFFGSYEYDDWYFKKLEDTVVSLEYIMEDYDDDDTFYYNAWW